MSETLEAELDRWRSAGLTPRAFLRDDDAVADTPALRRLFAVSERHAAPLLLACIPEPADESLGMAVRGFGLATGAVHGWRHESHAPKGEKPCELDRYRPPEVVLGELRAGREKLAALFGGRVSGLVVPPWNRIHDEVAAQVAKAGFNGVSAHGFGERPGAGGTPFVNVHVDVVHWSNGRTGRTPEWALGECAKAFALSREGGREAVGLLAHHLAHDEQAWATLDALMGALARCGVNFVEADSLLPASRDHA